jgi:Zn-finger nucleic acid-binding protein
MAPVGNRDHLYCPHCGSYYFPQETGDSVRPTGDATSFACPTCADKPLQTALVDDERVCYCDHCRGFLTRVDAFGVIVAKRRSLHSPREHHPGPFDPEELKRVINCPACKDRMEAHPYSGGGNVVVDTCDRCHLIWLDAGELAVIERYIPHIHQLEPTGRDLWSGKQREHDRRSSLGIWALTITESLGKENGSAPQL